MKESSIFGSSNIFNNKLRVLSFQSKEVLEILLRDKEYHPSVELSREGRDYRLEKEHYGFKDVIWCFSPIGYGLIKVNGRFTKEDFISGSLLFNFRCELSLPRNEDLNDLVLLELEYDKDSLRKGLTHNGCDYVYVAPQLKIENLVAVYRLNYNRIREAGWYYPEVFVESVYKSDPLFTEDFLCKEL